MFAIIQSGSKQVRVTPGGFATLDGTAGEPGAELTLGQVLLVEKDDGDLVAGAPFVADARVVAIVDGETRGPKDSGLQEKAPEGDAPHERPSLHLHARPHQGDSSLTEWTWLKKRTRQLTQRPRLELAAAGRQGARRQRRDRRHDHRPAARTPVPPGAERRPRQRRHDLREDRRPREVRRPRRARPGHQHSPARDSSSKLGKSPVETLPVE